MSTGRLRSNGQYESGHPFHGSRPASREIHRDQSQSSWTGRSPNPWSSARQPSPRTQTCWPYRFRTSPLPQHWLKRQQKCFATAAECFRVSSAHTRALCALVIVSRVVNVLEDMTKSVSSHPDPRRLGNIRTVDIGDEAEVSGRVGIMPQRFISHHRAQIRSAYSNVHHVADRACPYNRATPLSGSYWRIPPSYPKPHARRAQRSHHPPRSTAPSVLSMLRAAPRAFQSH